MTNETVIEELREQRDFLLENKWVPHFPVTEEQGCLAVRRSGLFSLSGKAVRCIQRVVGDRVNGSLASIGLWNDDKCRSAGEAIAVLEEAIRLAKEDTA